MSRWERACGVGSGWLLMVLVVAAPLMRGGYPKWDCGVLAILCGACVVVGYCEWTVRGHWAMADRTVLSVSLFLVVLLVILVPEMGEKEWFGIAALLLFPVLVEKVKDVAWRERMMWGLLVGGMAVALAGLVVKLNPQTLGGWLWKEPMGYHWLVFGTFYNHAHAAVVMYTALAACMAFLVKAERVWKKLLLVAVLLFLVVAAAANSSKAGIVASFMVVAVFAAMHGWRERGAKKSGWAVVTVILLAGLSLPVITWLFSKGGWFTAWSNFKMMPEVYGTFDPARIRVYREMIGTIIPESGWMGTGPGTFEEVIRNYPYAVGSVVANSWKEAHNDYLQLLLEWGVAGVAGWLILLGGGWVRLLLKLRDATDSITLAAWVSLSAIFAHAMIDYPFHVPALRVWILLLAAYGWASEMYKKA